MTQKDSEIPPSISAGHPDGTVPPSAREIRAGRTKGDAIAAGLRKLWADVENEPVPDDFLSMLDSIDDALARKAVEPGK